jgi:hypothetical protein
VAFNPVFQLGTQILHLGFLPSFHVSSHLRHFPSPIAAFFQLLILPSRVAFKPLPGSSFLLTGYCF